MGFDLRIEISIRTKIWRTVLETRTGKRILLYTSSCNKRKKREVLYLLPSLQQLAAKSAIKKEYEGEFETVEIGASHVAAVQAGISYICAIPATFSRHVEVDPS